MLASLRAHDMSLPNKRMHGECPSFIPQVRLLRSTRELLYPRSPLLLPNFVCLRFLRSTSFSQPSSSLGSYMMQQDFVKFGSFSAQPSKRRNQVLVHCASSRYKGCRTVGYFVMEEIEGRSLTFELCSLNYWPYCPMGNC